ncbi:MAG: stress response protein [Solirubrobacteraceae bacterium]
MATGAVSVPVGSEPEGWRHARLIPTYGTRTQQEQEKRATSCLLAVMHGVPEFGHALLKELGAPKSPAIETFAEVRFKNCDGKTVIPDGAIICRRGKKCWTCLVEVKTGSARLKDEQVASYLDVAREHGFDGVLTISTEITATSDESPVAVDGRKLRTTGLWHFSWWRVLTEAVVQQRYHGISDPDQEWVLRELIHYLSSEASGAVGFEDMGENWVTVRRSAHEGTLRTGNPAARDVAERWEQFTNYLALSLSQELGASVTAHRPRTQSMASRLDETVRSLVESGVMRSTLRIPDAVGPLEIRTDLRSRQTTTSVAIDAPREGRLKARFNWLMKQLADAPDDVRIEAAFPNARDTTAAALGSVREDQTVLAYPPDPKRGPRGFVVARSRPMGQKRGRAEGSFVRETSAQAVEFYRDLVQNLKPWHAPAPKLHTEAESTEAESTEVAIVPAWVGEPPAAAQVDGTSAVPSDGDLMQGLSP